MWIKLLLLVALRVFLKGSIASELQILSLIFVQMESSIATVAPSPSLAMTSSGTQSGPSDVKTVSSESKMQYYQRGECDLGWYQFGNYCYLPANEVKTFDHAQRACEYHNANLLSISNKEENGITVNISRDFFGFPRKNYIWLGMERRESTNRLHWIDGLAVNFGNWILGEPDSNGACVQMINKGLWEDTNCFHKIPFICKKRSSYPPPYSRRTELGILIGIPFAFALIVLTIVGILIFKSIRDADDTFYGYGKNRNKEKMHAALVNLTASIAHVSTVASPPVAQQASPRKGASRSASRCHSISSSHVNPAIDISDFGSQSPIQTRKESENGHVQIEDNEKDHDEDYAKHHGEDRDKYHDKDHDKDPEEIEMQVCVSSISIEKDQHPFQSTSLDQLVNLKPKSRRLKGLSNPDATVRRPGKEGNYRLKTYV